MLTARVQLWVCDVAGQAEPPYAAAVVIERVCVCAPLPHVTLHEPHVDHADTTQLIGQFCEDSARLWGELSDVAEREMMLVSA